MLIVSCIAFMFIAWRVLFDLYNSLVLIVILQSKLYIVSLYLFNTYLVLFRFGSSLDNFQLSGGV